MHYGETIALGLVPDSSRTVKAIPTELLNLVPRPTDNDRTIKEKDPDVVKETMPLIMAKAKRTAWQTKKLAAKLTGNTPEETLRNDSNFILHYIKYQEDDADHEEIRSPRRLVYEAKGDCDCFAVFLATLLINQGIKFKFRITRYEAGSDWSHIYIIVPTGNSYITLDPVTNLHNHEEPFTDHKDFTMGNLGSLKFLDGLPNTGANLNGLGCDCGVPGNDEQKPVIKRREYVGEKAMKVAGFVPAVDLLDQLGLSYTMGTDTNGTPYYSVNTPTGLKRLDYMLPSDPANTQNLVNYLTAVPEKIADAIQTVDIKKINTKWWWAIGGMAVGAWLFSAKKKAVVGKLGKLGTTAPSKKIAVLKM